MNAADGAGRVSGSGDVWALTDVLGAVSGPICTAQTLSQWPRLTYMGVPCGAPISL